MRPEPDASSPWGFMTTSAVRTSERVTDDGTPRPSRPDGTSRRNLVFALLVLAIVVLATWARALPVRADLPYSAYVDEQEVLRPAATILARSTWRPGQYNYPPLTMYATATVAKVIGLLPGGDDVTRAARATVRDPIRPNVHSSSIIVAGRLVTLVCAIATIVFAALLAARLRGRRAGVVAALFAAAAPALLVRSAIVLVDTVATCFATASLCCAAYLAHSRRPLRWAALAGLAAGLAGAAKYPSAAVFVAVVIVIAMAARPLRERAYLLAVAIGGAAVGALAGAPTILLETRAVVHELRRQADIYNATVTTSYGHDLRDAKEVGWLLLLLAAVGFVALLRAPRSRSTTIGGLVFSVVLFAYLARYPYQPFRNVLPIVPLLCVAAAAAIVEIVDVIARVVHLRARTAGAIVAVLAIAASAVMVGSVWRNYLNTRVHIHDSRVLARSWLADHVHPGDTVLVAQELAFLPAELRKLGAASDVRSVTSDVAAKRSARYAYVVVGDRPSTHRWLGVVADRRIAAQFGFGQTYLSPRSYRPPGELVRIFAASGTQDPKRCFPFCG